MTNYVYLFVGISFRLSHKFKEIQIQDFCINKHVNSRVRQSRRSGEGVQGKKWSPDAFKPCDKKRPPINSWLELISQIWRPFNLFVDRWTKCRYKYYFYII